MSENEGFHSYRHSRMFDRKVCTRTNGKVLLQGAQVPTAYEQKTTSEGFEPSRSKSNGLAIHRLNHSATMSEIPNFRYMTSRTKTIFIYTQNSSTEVRCNSRLDACHTAFAPKCNFLCKLITLFRFQKLSTLGSTPFTFHLRLFSLHVYSF